MICARFHPVAVRRYMCTAPPPTPRESENAPGSPTASQSPSMSSACPYDDGALGSARVDASVATSLMLPVGPSKTCTSGRCVGNPGVLRCGFPKATTPGAVATLLGSVASV